MKDFMHIFLALMTATSAVNITYNVVSLTNKTHSMGVIIDDRVYRLSVSDNSTLFHTGKAPIATKGYSYTVLEGDNILHKENFSRTPVESDTLNEYYNRTWNRWELDKLPTVLPPLPIINRIDSDLHIDGQIPTIHFVGNQTQLNFMHENQIKDGIKVSVDMTYISLGEVQNIKDVTLEISGQSTRLFPKLSYKLKIPKQQDLFGYRRLKLRAITGTDYSYMKEYLAYDMYNSVGLPTTKFSYVRLYMNNEPIGLFGLTENYKNPWIRNEFANGDKDYKQGAFYIAKIGDKNGTESATADLSYLGSNVSLYSLGFYSVREDPSNGKANFTRIMDLTKFISDASNTTTDNSVVPLWEKKMDVNSFLRGMAMEFLISNSDGYFVNANNYLLYDDLESEKLLFSASDFDLTMGFSLNTSIITGNYTEFPRFRERPLSKMLNVPKFKNEFENLLVNITRDLINYNTLMPRINQTYHMLLEDVEWDKSLPKMGHLKLSFMLPGNGSSSNETIPSFGIPGMNMTLDEMEDYMNRGLPFDSVVFGPMPFNLTVFQPLTEWISTHSESVLNFFNKAN